MVESVVFGQFRQIENKSDKFRQIQTNRTKSLIHPSLTYPPWRHVVRINCLRYRQLPAQTSIKCLPQMQCMHLGNVKIYAYTLLLWRARSRLYRSRFCKLLSNLVTYLIFNWKWIFHTNSIQKIGIISHTSAQCMWNNYFTYVCAKKIKCAI